MRADQLLMVFQVKIDDEDISELLSPEGKVTIIPFTAFVTSDMFSGQSRPGAADVQVTDAAGIRHMQAKYMFRGIDGEGNPCQLYVENNAFFEPGSDPSPFHACPKMMSDSPWLHERIAGNCFRAEGHPTEDGVEIRVFRKG